MSILQIGLIFFLIALNAFFVGVEFAVVASRRSRLDLLADPNHPALQLVHRWLEDEAARDRLIAASQLGITLVSLALGSVGEKAFEAWLEPFFEQGLLPPQWMFLRQAVEVLPLVLSLTIVTGLHVVLGEQVPKVAVLRDPEAFALRAARPMNAFVSVFRGFIDLLDRATRTILKIQGIPSTGHAHALVSSVEELRQIVTSPEVEQLVDDSEREMLTAVIDFGERVVRQVAVPRTEIIAVEAEQPLTEAAELAVREGVTKIPVYEENLDQIIGILHLKDLMARWVENRLENGCARDLVREALFVPDSLPVNDLLMLFRERRQHIAIVLDEYGGTAGLVTLEDLLEEIVGDVQDVFDAEPPAIQSLKDGSVLIDGMTLIEDINETFGLHLQDPNYDTIAGYVLGKLGCIPAVGEEVLVPENGVSLRVEAMDRLRIARVLMRRLSKPALQSEPVPQKTSPLRKEPAHAH
ncbi:hemolysin family protein [Anaerolinea sp.]|uniref:hemolysin family protein n=1 Tax=Anaerolinea sp. TaxID=1872519 RepID=UPI002611058E|nr:hemolysin family protein [uncultured Anaerolinea sp.]